MQKKLQEKVSIRPKEIEFKREKSKNGLISILKYFMLSFSLVMFFSYFGSATNDLNSILIHGISQSIPFFIGLIISYFIIPRIIVKFPFKSLFLNIFIVSLILSIFTVALKEKFRLGINLAYILGYIMIFNSIIIEASLNFIRNSKFKYPYINEKESLWTLTVFIILTLFGVTIAIVSLI